MPSLRDGTRDRDRSFIIDCDTCELQHSDACADCIVTFLCGRPAAEPVVVDLAEARALRTLGAAGLAPPLRHREAR